MQLPEPLRTKESPREILAADFKSLRGGLPIQGGWGYSKEDACVIQKDDPLVDSNLPFDGIGIEYVFVEKRIYEEMIIFQPEGGKYSEIRWSLQKQALVNDGDRRYDHLVFEVTSFRDADWDALKAEFGGPHGFGTPGFDEAAHENKRREKMIRLTRDFWFDVTSFTNRPPVSLQSEI